MKNQSIGVANSDDRKLQTATINSKLRHKASLFGTAYLQVFLVSANTYFISHLVWIGIATAGFGISYIWTINVRKVNFGSRTESIIYSLGAMAGGLTGVWAAQLI